MRWFYEHRRFSVIAAIFLLLLVMLLTSYQLRDSDSGIGKAAQSVVTVFQAPFAALANSFGGATGGILTDKKLLVRNQQLSAQVNRLEDELTKSRLDADQLSELQQLSKSLDATSLSSKYKLKAANVLSFDGSSSGMFNVFTIDVGTESGVKHNTVVVNGDGLIGRVLKAGRGWARVVSIIDETNNVGFQISTNLNYLGICHGDGTGSLSGSLLDEQGNAKKGDQLITSGIGGVYPAGLSIGIVEKAVRSNESPFMQVTVKPNVYFKGLKKVAVLV